MANTYISRSISGSPTNPDKFTISMWVKRCGLGAEQSLMGQYASSNFRGKLSFLADDRIEYIQKNDGNTTANLITTRKFRDTNAWYHIVVQFDTSQGTDSNRIKIYINGTQETAFDTTSYPAQDLDMRLNQASGTLCIGQDGNGGNYCDLLLSHVHLVDGATEAPTVFGSQDATTGEWNIKTSPTISEYGDDGFFVLKDGNSVTDQSGKSNNFTVGGGTLTKTQDNPSNNFTNLNFLFEQGGTNSNFTHGNCTGQSRSAQGGAGTSTFGVSSGKFYAEFKQSAESAANEGSIAVVDSYFISNNQGLGGSSSPGYFEYSVGCFGLRNSTTPVTYYSSSGAKATSSNTHAGWSNGDIIMIALDMDNSRVYFGKNGQWNASNTWSSATPSQYITIDSTNFTGTMHFGVGDSSGGNHVTWQCNFGNGFFGTTAVATEGTNASNNGIFEYDVPTGYTALSTKGLNL